ncbi:FtsX-like permease family protein [Rudanella paleaurantiibacter]|uniref:FtsX-like permease family protein n=1 Tax=Rudanella paleaurantiibacter TaxID=2614655 RepID=A0A7J5U6S0_9BACT|nr:ABC transporter permease [Rudanella paleaurantiibacter]KAB7732850.1 FtsX-like permease family protein [Rudanella paleaurantiibacter]
MLTNYLKIAWRNLMRHKGISAINLVGLAFGLATCLLISLFVFDELSYDRFNTKADRIVRVIFRASINNEKIREATVMPPVAQTLKAQYPEVLEATRIRDAGTPVVAYADKAFREENIAYVDSNFFEVFTLPFRQGNSQTALNAPNTAVITTTMAQKYFGTANPMGQVLTFKGWNRAFRITGVMEPIPTNAHFHFDMLVSMAGLDEARQPTWMASNFFTYLVLPEGYNYRQLEAKLPQVIEKYMGPQLKQSMGMSLSQFRQKGNEVGLFLQPLTDIHLRSDIPFDLEPGSDIRYVYMFGAIALFMLLIACINFMNLSTAGSSKRAREVGIRKVMGSLKQELVGQFLCESILLTLLALTLGLVLAYAALPYFNALSGKTLTLSFQSTPWLMPGLLAFGLLVGLLAGSYPAFFLSAFRPINVLKGGSSAGKLTGGGQSIGLRRGLVVFQFFVSICLIMCTTVVYQQLQFIQHKKLGYDKEQVLVMRETWRLGAKEEQFRQELLRDARVINATVSGYVPAGPSNSNNFTVYPDNSPMQLFKTLAYEVDERYIPTLGMQIRQGRNFSRAFGTDSTAVILNQTAARVLGWGDTALGHTLSRTDNNGRKATYHVIGIVNDFHFRSLHEPISPLVMLYGHNGGSVIAKVKTPEVTALLASLQKQWTAYGTEAPFLYTFLNESYNNTYRAEQKTGQILGLFAGLTIFVACLGLFGLAMFTAEQRTKEIGVRKVLGASVLGIVALLSRDFLKLVAIAILLASPIAWWVMQQWLQGFAYKIDMSIGVFVGAGGLAILIALLTVSYQSIRAARVNPVKSLRSE